MPKLRTLTRLLIYGALCFKKKIFSHVQDLVSGAYIKTLLIYLAHCLKIYQTHGQEVFSIENFNNFTDLW